ncbi:hypothetical protein [Caballeronia telluris]|uniref:hypothetical protein n=1 Tax=Caballeronia telluris TaxID=326475 RepID=UPI001F1D7238|nr:hypothetical protein [Caballeronia telluris]
MPVRIEDHALMQVVPQMDAEVMRLDLAAHVVGIHVEPIKPRTHRLKGKFGLREARGEIEQAMLCGMTFSDIRHRACTSPDHYARRRREPGDNASRDRRELAPLIQQSTSRPHERLLLPGSHHFSAIAYRCNRGIAFAGVACMLTGGAYRFAAWRSQWSVPSLL